MLDSKRDGRCLRVISAARRLDREGLAATLRRTIETRPDVQMEIQQHDMSVRTQPGRLMLTGLYQLTSCEPVQIWCGGVPLGHQVSCL